LSLYGATFDPIIADPGQTYTMLKFDVDRTGMLPGASTDGQCGCMERGVCIEMYDVSYVDGDGLEQRLFSSYVGLNWNDPGNGLSCGGQWCDLSPEPCPWAGDTLCVANGPTPAAKRSWGSVKAGYR
jgi:hypothetical protein